LADILASDPGLLVTHSATELAHMAGTSKAAATRLFQRIGYATFAAARREAREAQRWGVPGFQAVAAVPADAAAAFRDHLQRDLDNLTGTFANLADSVVAEVAEAIARARRVVVIGFRNSHVLAQYLGRQLALVHPHVDVLPRPGQTLGEDFIDVNAEDLCIAIGLRRRVPVLARVLQQAQRNGTHTLLIADRDATSRRWSATWKILCETRGSGWFDSYVAPVSVLNFIVSAVVQRDPAAARRRLRKAEAAHGAFEELDAD
jgi:DNA-binding MurR/RpiR family transcriptional regulator